jgi:hypothetical protein
MRTDPSKRIPTNDDTAEQWIAWHKSLKRWFHKKEANEHWLGFWNQRAGAGSEPDTHTLRKYMEDQGVDLTTTNMNSFKDSAIGIVDWFGDTFNAIRFIVLGAVVVGVGLIAYYVIKKTNQGKSAKEMIPARPSQKLIDSNFTSQKLIS